MTMFPVVGDPLLTRAQALAFGHNARGRMEVGDLETALYTRFPPAFSAYRKRCQTGRIKAGDYWVWMETSPRLYFMTVRQSSVGATRLRYVQASVMRLVREYTLEGIAHIAIAPLGDPYEWQDLLPMMRHWLDMVALPVAVYTQYHAGVQADEPF